MRQIVHIISIQHEVKYCIRMNQLKSTNEQQIR